MRSVSVAHEAGAASNIIPFRRTAHPAGSALRGGGGASARADQRSLMDLVYATGTFLLSAEDRATKLVASRLQVYGFLAIEEVGEDGALRRLRPSEAIRARADRPWRLSKAAYGSTLSVTIPTVDGFLFEPGLQPLGA